MRERRLPKRTLFVLGAERTCVAPRAPKWRAGEIGVFRNAYNWDRLHPSRRAQFDDVIQIFLRSPDSEITLLICENSKSRYRNLLRVSLISPFCKLARRSAAVAKRILPSPCFLPSAPFSAAISQHAVVVLPISSRTEGEVPIFSRISDPPPN